MIEKNAPKITVELINKRKKILARIADSWKFDRFDDVWITDENVVQPRRNKVSV